VSSITNCMLKISRDEKLCVEMGRESSRIVAEWSLDRFARGLLDAVEIAMDAGPECTNFFDKTLLRSISPA
ncbi:MAG: hypothetical protein KC519_13165, partial [Anaerolineae bacterium]|nr:hypothetical protein [Anaerolineae bacterium]